MKKNLVVIAAVVTTVVLATGCGQKAAARKTPEATPIETTCNRADDPANKGYALVGSGQTTVGSDHVEYLSDYAGEFKDPDDCEDIHHEYAGEFDLDAYEATKPTPKS